jgi:formate hydrogenlyase subunit 6/NADH:ubiquinone oxidoreductase subunit I
MVDPMASNPVAKVVEQLLGSPSTLEFPEQKESTTDNYRGITSST